MSRLTKAKFGLICSISLGWLIAGRTAAAGSDTIVTAAPAPVGYENDVYCFGYLGPDGEAFAGTLVSGDAIVEQTDFTEGDIVYVDSPEGLHAGDEYWLITPQEEVFHPVTDNMLGMFYQYRGRARVLCVKGTAAILQVTAACTEIPLGTRVKPFEPIPVPLARRSLPMTCCDDANGKKIGTIVYSRDNVASLAEGYEMIVDLGADANLSPGDFVTVFRYSPPPSADISVSGELYSIPSNITIPRTILGEAAVLTVGDHTSTLRVTTSQHNMKIGDRVEIK